MIEEIEYKIIHELDNINTSIDFHKVMGSIVLLDQAIMLKAAYLTVAFKGGRSDLAKQVHNELQKQNFKLIIDFVNAGKRRGYYMDEYRLLLNKCNGIRRYWEHNEYIDFIKIRDTSSFLTHVSKIKEKLKEDISILLDINTQFDIDFVDYFEENKWFKKCLA